MPRNYKMHVWEVQQAAQSILEFTDGRTYDDYVTDLILRSAVERQINKIGGALARLIVNDDPTAQRIGGYGGNLGWGQNLDSSWSDEEKEIWDFVQNELPQLLQETTAVLEEEPVDQPIRVKPQSRKINPLVVQHSDELAEICRRHHVKRLDVFGSAVVGNFNPQTSDIDFLVDYHLLPPSQHADAYFGLLEDLQSIFGRSIDLVEDKAIENPYFRASVDETREPIYGR